MKDNLVYDTDPAVRSQMNDEVCAIEALPAVSGLKQMPTSGSKGAGFQASLRCFASREHGSCGQKQEPPVHLTQSRTTLLGCLQQLRRRLETRHGSNCVAAVEAMRERQAATHGCGSAGEAGSTAGVLNATGRRTRGAGLRQLQGMGPTRFVLAVDDDNEFRSRCE